MIKTNKEISAKEFLEFVENNKHKVVLKPTGTMFPSLVDFRLEYEICLVDNEEIKSTNKTCMLSSMDLVKCSQSLHQPNKSKSK